VCQLRRRHSSLRIRRSGRAARLFNFYQRDKKEKIKRKKKKKYSEPAELEAMGDFTSGISAPR